MTTDATQVYPGLWVGSEDDAFCDKILDHFLPTVTAVLNVAEEVHTHLGWKTTNTYKKVDLDELSDIVKVLLECMSFIHTNLNCGDVIVHCKHGQNCSVSIIIAYICLVTNKQIKDVRTQIDLVRPNVCPASWFLKEIDEWLESNRDYLKNTIDL